MIPDYKAGDGSKEDFIELKLHLLACFYVLN
jgi:hypothetical protein